jgi:hypothetical protein
MSQLAYFEEPLFKKAGEAGGEKFHTRKEDYRSGLGINSAVLPRT